MAITLPDGAISMWDPPEGGSVGCRRAGIRLREKPEEKEIRGFPNGEEPQ